MTHPVVHFEVIGKDGKKLQDFYSKVFGWQIDANNPMDYGMVAGGDGGIGGGVGEGDVPFATFYVQVDDPAATLKQIEAAGGKTLMPPMDVPGGPTIAQFKDPEGNTIGLVKGM